MERLCARLRVGLTGGEAWSGLVDGELEYDEALGLARHMEGFRFLGVQTQRCGEWEGRTARFEHGETGLVFRLVPGGRSVLGTPVGVGFDFEQELRAVWVRPFLLAEVPCTQEVWDAAGLGLGGRSVREGPEVPVHGVSWEEACVWCEVVGLRLPSEDEWEHASRGGSEGLYGFGDDFRRLVDHGWFVGNGDGRPQPVGRLAPNAWGLFDCMGNVSEWCVRFRRVASSEELPALRGGNWSSVSANCRVCSRWLVAAEGRVPVEAGFRPAHDLGPGAGSVW